MKNGMALKEHIAVVTGAGSGIGQAMAIRLAKEEIPTVAADLDYEAALKTVNTIESLGGKATAVKGDVSQEEDVKNIFDHCTSEYAPCTLLCNNAGHAQQKPFLDITVEDFDHMIGVHMRGMFMCAKAVLPNMLSSGDGVIINTASQLGYLGAIELAHYAAAKAGVMAFTRCVAIEAAEYNIRVNCVAPSLAMHPNLAKSSNQDLIDSLIEKEVMGRAAEPWEVANVMVFLASEYSSYMTGEVISVSSQHP